jgi:hypothetical protein
MADYAIGLSFHKAHRTLVRALELTPPRRYFATRNADGFVTLPSLDLGQTYVELQAITQSSFQINDNDQEFRILGDDGWADSLITGSRVQASNTAYFMKDTQVASDGIPLYKGNYDEGFALIEKSRYNKDFEIYVEFLKEIGQAEGQAGNWIYDFTGFNCVLMNFNEQKSAEGLTEVMAGNVLTLNPDVDLAAGTIFRLAVPDGAVTQRVDGTGAASASGVRRPIQGLTISFRTA